MEIIFYYHEYEDEIKALNLEEMAAWTLHEMTSAEKLAISVSFVNNDEMARFNKDFRDIEGPTDVLSFPCDTEDDDVEFIVPEELFQLGDIIIAPEIARQNAHDLDVLFEDELELLLVHGILHLLGYDHVKDDDAEKMQFLERKLLNAYRLQKSPQKAENA